MIDDISTALAHEHRRDLGREAAAARLACLATACSPSSLRDRTGVVLRWLRNGQLGKGYAYSAGAPVTARSCAC